MDFFAGEANIGGGCRDNRVLFWNAFGCPVVGTNYLASILRRVVFVGEATLCLRLDGEGVSLRAGRVNSARSEAAGNGDRPSGNYTALSNASRTGCDTACN